MSKQYGIEVVNMLFMRCNRPSQSCATIAWQHIRVLLPLMSETRSSVGNKEWLTEPAYQTEYSPNNCRLQKHVYITARYTCQYTIVNYEWMLHIIIQVAAGTAKINVKAAKEAIIKVCRRYPWLAGDDGSKFETAHDRQRCNCYFLSGGFCLMHAV